MEPSRRWVPQGTGAWYDKDRWSNRHRRERDPRIVREILKQYGEGRGLLLDAPCGTGRLAAAIGEHGVCVGLDASMSMLAEAHGKLPGLRLCGDVNRMPFQSGTFDAVLCCRLLHHLKAKEELEDILRELLRVSRGVVAGSFWDAHSMAAMHRRLPFVRKPIHRAPFTKAFLAKRVQAAGGRVVAWKHSARYFSQQAWFVARKA